MMAHQAREREVISLRCAEVRGALGPVHEMVSKLVDHIRYVNLSSRPYIFGLTGVWPGRQACPSRRVRHVACVRRPGQVRRPANLSLVGRCYGWSGLDPPLAPHVHPCALQAYACSAAAPARHRARLRAISTCARRPRFLSRAPGGCCSPPPPAREGGGTRQRQPAGRRPRLPSDGAPNKKNKPKPRRTGDFEQRRPFHRCRCCQITARTDNLDTGAHVLPRLLRLLPSILIWFGLVFIVTRFRRLLALLDCSDA